MITQNNNLIRIGIFYDGNYFHHVSNYYNYVHDRKSRISIAGLHRFIRSQVAQEESIDTRECQIVEAHYFRGRLNARDASQRGNQLYYDRVFDDILISEGVIAHYLPIKSFNGHRTEKGVDVWLALDAYEKAITKKFEIIVLIASDGDYVPLIRKLNGLGTRVMVLSWDFEYTTEEGHKIVTRTSQDLLEEVTYPIAMNEIIDNRVRRNDPLVSNLFVQVDFVAPKPTSQAYKDAGLVAGERKTSTVHSLKVGYGFIAFPPNNLFFHYTSLEDIDFNELREGDLVEFVVDYNDHGEPVAKQVKFLGEGELEEEDDEYYEDEFVD